MVIVVVAGCAVLLYPFEQTDVPFWRIQVVDTSGNPVPSVGITESWQNYSTELNSHEEESVTDAMGYAMFPERKERASALQRVLVGLSNIRATVHSSW